MVQQGGVGQGDGAAQGCSMKQSCGAVDLLPCCPAGHAWQRVAWHLSFPNNMCLTCWLLTCSCSSLQTLLTSVSSPAVNITTNTSFYAPRPTDPVRYGGSKLPAQQRHEGGGAAAGSGGQDQRQGWGGVRAASEWGPGAAACVAGHRQQQQQLGNYLFQQTNLNG